MKKIFTLVFLAICGAAQAQTGFAREIITDETSGDFHLMYTAIADIDGDGKNDVVSKGSTKILWHKNIDGHGTFGRGKTILTGESMRGFITGDIDGDGDKDIIFHRYSEQSQSAHIGFIKNDGAGNFAPVVMIASLGNTIADVNLYLSDIDADGKPDLVFIKNNAVCWSKNTNGQNFASPTVIAQLSDATIVFTCSDFTNDGLPDIVYNHVNTMGLIKNIGDGNFAAMQPIDTASIGFNIAAADMDSDGNEDIVFIRWEQDSSFSLKSLVWYKNNNNGQFGARQTLVTPLTANNSYDWFWLETADFDNDGKHDIGLSRRETGKLAWYKNMGNGIVAAEQVIAQNMAGIINFAVGHINTNESIDVVASNAGYKLSWYKNTPDGFNSEVNITSAVFDPNKADTGDIDGDGYIDIVVSSGTDKKITWYKNNNGQGFTGNQNIVTSSLNGACNATLVDIDNDGDLDIMANSTYFMQGSYTSLFCYKNNGQGIFTQQLIIPEEFGNPAYSYNYVDVDSDGDKDIIAYIAPAVKVYKNNGNGTFANPYAITPWTTWPYPNKIFFGDIDNDGKPDMLTSTNNIGSQVVAVKWYKNLGTGTFSPATDLQNIPFGEFIITDMNADGKNDLVSLLQEPTEIAWFQGMGSGAFSQKKFIATTFLNFEMIKVGDIDGDGNKDIVSTSHNGQALVWYRNNVNTGTFSSTPIIYLTPGSGPASSIAVTDINGDGKNDIAACSVLDDSVSWFKNVGEYYNTITGTVRFDVDANGCTPTDTTAQQVLVTSTNGSNTWSSFTNVFGVFTTNTNQGTYNTTITSPLANFTATPQSQQSAFTNNSGGNSTLNFCLQTTTQITDLDVSIYNITEVRPGFPVRYKVVVKNTGTVPAGGSLVVNFDSAKLNYDPDSSSQATVTGDNLNYNIGTVSVFQSKEFIVNFIAKTIPTINLGDEVVLTANATVAGDATPDDNSATDTATVVGSYDPNDITVLEGSQILLEDADEYLHYLIRFQNTGNYYAERVVVKNPIDSKLDWTTMQIESMSHNGRVEIINGAEATFTFDAIYLPAVTVNEPASHGYIAYKIKPKANVQLGDTFTEQAHIFFDFNPAIDTNIVTTTVVDAAAGLPQFTAETVTVYPVPSKNILNIKANTGIARIEIYNQAGQRVLSNVLQNSIDISALSQGIYFAKIEDVNGSSVTKKVVKN